MEQDTKFEGFNHALSCRTPGMGIEYNIVVFVDICKDRPQSEQQSINPAELTRSSLRVFDKRCTTLEDVQVEWASISQKSRSSTFLTLDADETQSRARLFLEHYVYNLHLERYLISNLTDTPVLLLTG